MRSMARGSSISPRSTRRLIWCRLASADPQVSDRQHVHCCWLRRSSLSGMFLLHFSQLLCDFGSSTGPVADLILFFEAQLRHRPAQGGEEEHGVVTEPVGAARLV